MFDLIEKINFNTKINVCGENHFAQTKTLYITEGEQENWYAKIVFEDHSILVIAPFDEFMYFGKIENIFGDGENFVENITYNDLKFVKSAEDYQIVKQLVFGNPLVAEGEVKYADYASDDDENTIISLAVVSRTSQRADVIAKIISKDDVIIC